MNFFEAEYVKAERRVRKIQANPDPTKLRSNVMLYELEMELRAHQVEAWKQGKPFCAGLGAIPALVSSMGFESLVLLSEADRITDIEPYFEAVRAHEFPDHHCDRAVVGVGMMLRGELPVPAMVVSSNFACDPEMLAYQAVGHMFPTNRYHIDVDAVDNKPSQRLLDHNVAQFQAWIDFAESRVPGIKFNEDRLAELSELDGQAYRYLAEIYQFRKRRPCPVAGQDVFRLPRSPSRYPNPKKVVEYYRVMRDEIGERAEKGLGAVKQEKLRIMWTITAPYFADLFRVLEDEGASVVHFHVGPADRWYGISGYYGDQAEYGRRLSSLEEQARVLTLNTFGGLADHWADKLIDFGKELGVDGVIHFEQWGCVAAAPARLVAKDRIEAELGVPNLFYEGRNMDTSSVDLDDLKERLRMFVGICADRKAIRHAAADQPIAQ